MHFTVAPKGPLSGSIVLPGDLRLTLALMSLGMQMEEPLTVTHPSCAQEVLNFRKFLERYGATFSDSEDGFTISGKRLSGDVDIDYNISDYIIHSIAAGAVFTARSVRIAGGASDHAHFVRPLTDILRLLGVHSDNVTDDGNDVLIKGAEFTPSDVVTVRTQWAFEVVTAASLAARCEVTVSYPPVALSPPEKVLTALGFKLTRSECPGSHQAELERRLAKASGEKPHEVNRILWSEKPAVTFEIPGDSMIAAAVAGCAVVIQRSDVTLERVVWDVGRRGFFDALRRMKAYVTYDAEKGRQVFDTADIRIKWSKIDGVHLSPEQADAMFTELLVLAAVASSARGETVISDTADAPGAGREAFKFVARGLEKCGVHIGDYTEGIVLRGVSELRGEELDSGRRPDVACALAVAGMSASGTTTIVGCNDDAYPVGDFLRLIHELSGSVL